MSVDLNKMEVNFGTAESIVNFVQLSNTQCAANTCNFTVRFLVNFAALLHFPRECAATVRPESQYALDLSISLCTHLNIKIYRTII
jgi:hypothetical protein